MTERRGARSRVSVRAPAKINLGLEVLGRRRDGYHEIVTVFQEVTLADRVDLALRSEPGVVLAIRPPGLDLGPAEENLAVRASELLLRRAGELRGAGRTRPTDTDAAGADSGAGSGGALRSSGLPGVRIRLTKRIPVGAGLGGGSADAAATLVGLSALLRARGFATPPLPGIARELGADVPFFLQGGTRLGTGRGDVLAPFPPWPFPDLVLVFPNVSVSTSSVFGRWETGLTPPGPLARMGGLEIPPTFWRRDLGHLCNDLQPIVVALHPRVGDVLEEFRRLGSRFARMSGSGSTVFGVAGDRAEAREWAESFRVRGLWATAVRAAGRGCRIRKTGTD